VQRGRKYLPFDHFGQGLSGVGGCWERHLLEVNPSNHSQNCFHFHMRLNGNLCADQNIVEADEFVLCHFTWHGAVAWFGNIVAVDHLPCPTAPFLQRGSQVNGSASFFLFLLDILFPKIF
jgi:hypothetical protein